ncbi:MAG TPA: sigma-70 family RNA polymerase sigma factor [Candidatus Binatia bacterium]|nr:sigma-70 family RNA polymerase sigma factor [Candidatus Binatia bacterium]
MDVRGLDDAELAGLITAAGPGGARDAEAELYARLAPRVRLYGLRHLRNPQAAADLTQQVLLMTIERLRGGKVREPQRLASYVLGTCRMVVREFRRGRRRRERLLERFAGDLSGADAAETPCLDTGRLAACLERLNERERSVLVLTFWADRRSTEVARDLGLTAANVRVIRHRALARLRLCLNGGEAGT